MPTVTVYTAARMQAIEDDAIVGGSIDGSGHLILEPNNGAPVDAGPVISAAGTPFVGQYTTAGRPTPVGADGKILWDITLESHFISTGATWEPYTFASGLEAFIGQYATVDRPSAVGRLGEILWDVTLENFYKSDDADWNVVAIGGGGGDVSSTSPSTAGWTWVLNAASVTTLDDTKVPTWSKTKNYVDAAAIASQIASTDTGILDVYTVGGITYLDVSALGSGANGPLFNDDVFALQNAGDNTKDGRFSLSGLTTGTARIWSMPDISGDVLTHNSSADISNKKLATPTGLGTFYGKFADFMMGGLDFGYGGIVAPSANQHNVFGGPVGVAGITAWHNGALTTTPTAPTSSAEVARFAARAMRSNSTFTTTDLARISMFLREVPSTTAQGSDARIGVTRVGTLTLENVFGVQGGADASTGGTVTIRNRVVIGAGDMTTLPATGYAAEFKHATEAFGYGVGAGAAVTQLTSKATASPAITTPNGTVTTHAASLAAATVVSFVLTNANIAANDHIEVTHVSGGTVGAYYVFGAAAAGSATIYIRNLTAGALAEALVLRYRVIRGSVT